MSPHPVLVTSDSEAHGVKIFLDQSDQASFGTRPGSRRVEDERSCEQNENVEGPPCEMDFVKSVYGSSKIKVPFVV